MADSSDIAFLRCEADRLAAVAIGDGAALSLPAPDGDLDDALVQVVADVGGYAITLWELQLLRDLGYVTFNQAFDALQAYVEEPDKIGLERNVRLFAALFAGAANRRGVPPRCGAHVTFPGLEPPDPRLLPANLPDDLDVPQADEEGRRVRSSAIPLLVPIATGLGAGVFLVGAAVLRRTQTARPFRRPRDP